MVRAAPQAGKGRRDRVLTRVGVFVNLEKDAARDALGRFTRWLRAKGVEPMLLDTQADALGEPGAVGADTFFAKPDLIVSLGGDGTFLHAARHIHGPTPPLLGVNFGHLGYLTAVEASDLGPLFERVLPDEVPVEHRLRLGCEVPGWRDSPPALNDIVIQILNT